jgi:hypothetical protein
MELTIQAILIIATFSVVHERVIEFLRWWIGKLPGQSVRDVLGTLTQGAWAWVPAIGLSIFTNANLLAAFQLDAEHQPMFFTDYLNGTPHTFKEVLGCCLMGLAVTLGSSVWHDAAKALIEVRGWLQDVKLTPEQQLARTPLPAAPPEPSTPGLVTA